MKANGPKGGAILKLMAPRVGPFFYLRGMIGTIHSTANTSDFYRYIDSPWNPSFEKKNEIKLSGLAES